CAMTTSSISARSVLTVGLQQIALAAVVFVLVVLWLQIPDANAFEVFASVVLALLIALLTGAGECAIALGLIGRRFTARSMCVGTCVVLVAAFFWWLLSAVIDHVSANDALRAGYWNSRFPASLRNVFTFEHLVVWLGWGWSLLRYVIAGLVAAAAFAVIASGSPVRATLAIWGSIRYWVFLLLFVVVGAIVTDTLIGWTPGHGIRVELLSLAARLLLVILLNAATVALLMQSMAHAVLRTQAVGGVDPVTSHPRTEDMP
ncbi:MAG: hypothetical protein V4734_10995, partial [Terriglobus sp.]